MRFSITSPEIVDISEEERLKDEKRHKGFYSRSETDDSGSEELRTENRKNTGETMGESKEGKEQEKEKDKEKEESTSSGEENERSKELELQPGQQKITEIRETFRGFKEFGRFKLI